MSEGATVLPDALDDQGILLVNGVIAVGCEPVDDDIGACLDIGCRKPGRSSQWNRDEWIMN